MAAIIRKCVLSTVLKHFNKGSAHLLKQGVQKARTQCFHSANGVRSIWQVNGLLTARAFAVPQTWSVCKLHTEVDRELTKFLDKEIELEEKSAQTKVGMPSIKDFDVTADGCDFTLKKKMGNEKISVMFNINGSADADQPVAGSQEGEDVHMVSKPPFRVEIDKGSGEILAFQCMFANTDEVEPETSGQPEDAIVDLFEIQDVTLHKGEWKESIYTMSSETMDGNLYDLLMDLLDERGINDEFINDLIEFSTAQEHDKYLEFLKNLNTFVKKD
ncbi:complement component 1 Q subcomponent-binding protein, mitochondrial-like [Gigantopelta aegis]|uniref:complement component 1 Q subcomponent-binding protein, mitochondrial-like n=1 Tax=Gigantopelta aegis TaxID=1735272 RepID=UPI001B88A2A8|nr:complement component 1 Q subcomponent-binding protein, mitochondrial-like [Gigantopelta aegis]